MNVWLQIIIGFAPFLVLSVIIMIMRSYYTARTFISLAASLLVVVLCSYMLFTSSTTDARRAFASEQDDWYMLGVYMLEGDLHAAESILQDLYDRGVYDERYTLYAARLELLNGRPQQAATLYAASQQTYQNLNNDRFPEEELAFFPITESLVNADSASLTTRDEALYRYLEMQGKSPSDYGVAKLGSTVLTVSPNEEHYSEAGGERELNKTAGTLARQQALVQQNIARELRAMREADPVLEELESHVNLILDTNAMFEAYTREEEIDRRELRKIVRRFEEITSDDNPALQSKDLRLARMKALLMDDQLREIPKYTGADPDLNELVVLSELYINGLANRSDYESLVANTSREVYDRVIAQAEKVYREQYQNESRRDRNLAKEQIDTLRDESRHLPLAEIRNRIIDQMNDSHDRERSKTYLQLSKIENYLGNEKRSATAMDQALTSATDSTDAQYAEPMRKIMQVIQQTADSEDVKNVPRYVTSAVNHSLPLPIHDTARSRESGSANDAEKERPFDQYFTEYVGKKRAELTIGMIDTSQFPYIEARVQLSHDLDTKDIAKLLEVYDQGIKIEDFTFEKLDFNSSRIMLLTDNSGSMSGSIQDLKLAVEEFISGMDDDETVSIVTFDHSIRLNSGFTNDANKLLDVTSELGAHGGTAVYSSLLYGMDQFPDDIDSNHVIILMTDGLDGSPASDEKIRLTVGAKSLQQGISVYTIGLGQEVDTAYLESIALHGNGSFIYASGAANLRAFYDFIHEQASNQYILRYTARNTVDPNRELKILIPQTNSQATKTYRLYDDTDLPEDEDSFVHDGKIGLYGLDKKLIYRGNGGATEVVLRGEGFEQLSNFSVTFSGPAHYTIDDAAIVDDGNIKLTIPANMTVGIYDLVMLADGKRYVLPAEFELAIPGRRQTIKFGPYTLSANEVIEEGDDALRLKGRVRLNDYIQFRGDVLLNGDPKRDLRISLTDLYGSSITFDPNNSIGLSWAMAKLGINLDFSSFGTFDLYLDERHMNDYDSYTVDRIGSKNKLVKLWGLALDHSSLYIYPDSIKIDFERMKLQIPYQDVLMRYAGETPFIINSQASAQITPNNIGLVSTLKMEREGGLKSFSVGKLPVELQSFEASIDTLKHDYEVDARIGIETLPVVDSFGMKLGVKGGKFDTIMVFADIPVPVAKAPVPISLSNFGLGIQDMSKVQQGAGFKETLLQSYLTGQLDVEAGNIGHHLPFLKKLLPDAPLIAVSDATVKARAKDFSLLFNADIDLFGKITLASLDIRVGHFDYSNYLLNIPEQDVTGLYVETNRNIAFDANKVKFDYTGATSLTFNTAASGLWGSGAINYEVDWFVVQTEQHYNGNIWIGAHAPGGKPQFTILIKGTDLKNNNEKGGRLVFKDGSIVPSMTLY